MEGKKVTEVVAALIWDGNRFLICQRPAHKARGLLWEFVGGKVEPGEQLEQALVRECREELGVTVQPRDVFLDVTHFYPDISVHLTLFHASIVEGTVRPLEHNDLRWILVSEIGQYEFCPADVEILARLEQGAVEPPSVRRQLFDLQDFQFRDFNRRLVPNMDPAEIIGVQVPALRSLAKMLDAETADRFLSELPHFYQEENTLHGLLIAQSKDYDWVIRELDRFLPYVNNWATCDVISPKVFKKFLPELEGQIKLWIASGNTYTIRFGLEMLMTHFLDRLFKPEYLDLAVGVQSEEYYVNMMVAWFLATALAKQYEATLPILTQHRLSPWIHNKTIQKAIESNRITPGQKDSLRALKVKKDS